MKAEEDKNGRETATMTSRNIYWFSIGCLQSDLAYFLITWLVTASQRHAWEPIVELKKAFEEGPGWLLKRKRSVFCPDIPCILVFEAHSWIDFKNFCVLNECGAFWVQNFFHRTGSSERKLLLFLVTYPLGSATVTYKCFRSMNAPFLGSFHWPCGQDTLWKVLICCGNKWDIAIMWLGKVRFFIEGGGGGPGPRRGGSLVNFFTNWSNLFYSQPR